MDKNAFDAFFARAARPKPPAGFTGVVLEGKITRGTYKGTRGELAGRTALVRRHGQKLFAQFDDYGTGLAHGWHEFDIEEFIYEVDVC